MSSPPTAPPSPAAAVATEAAYLQGLDIDVQNQQDLERNLAQRADKLLAEKAEENETKRLDKALVEKDRVDSQIRQTQRRLAQPVGAATQRRLEVELSRLKSRRAELTRDVVEIQERIDGQREAQQTISSSHGPGRLPNESRREYLLRTGKITPFDLMNSGASGGPAATLHDALVGAEDEQREEEEREQARHDASHRNLARPGHDFKDPSHYEASGKRRKLDTGPSSSKPTPETTPVRQKTRKHRSSASPASSASYVASDDTSVSSEDDDYMPDTIPEESVTGKRKRRKDTIVKDEAELEDLSGVDDGDESVYRERLNLWTQTRSAARRQGAVKEEDNEEEPEWRKPHPQFPDLELPNGLSVPGDIAQYLFSYQKTGVQWLWELHQQSVGGIVGDEMGLGKTIQAITYLASLHHSGMYTKPAIVVCPATLMKQWVTEFHNWWPPLRVSILHSSGSGMLNVNREQNREDILASEMMGTSSHWLSSGHKAARNVLKRVVEEGHVLVTTYSGLQSYADALVDVEWGCAILDEGHKIRNPDAGITFSCKELRTPHRIILSGTPIQNSLIDLWSLFDFVFPMRLGTLVTFKSQFEIPIRQGGYASASNLQVQTAAKCAETLKDAISPYLLQRFKTDVASDLPKKSEQVIFCKLTPYQRRLYKEYLGSDDVQSIYKGKKKSFAGIDTLRKLCNHPDLADRQFRTHEADYGHEDRSGKMQVLKSLLELWKDTGHKTLLFAQTVQMLDILEKFVRSLGGFTLRRMDGGTPIPKRHGIVTEFNVDPDLHVFLLTTKVGGIGINLTGADRVIIFDPDWNPSTDIQACERAWRLGQQRDVTIFRLMMKGTIEEKIYHRQIFKQFMTNKITKNPQQRENFQFQALYDLFSLTEEDDGELETTKLFKDAETTYQEQEKETPSSKIPSKKRRRNSNSKPSSLSPPNIKTEEQTDNLGNLSGIANVEQFRTGSPSEAEADGNGAASDANQTRDGHAEDRLMHSIFARSGVHAALEHDQIINGKRVIKADPKMIEAEARRVANEAAANLRRAEEAARSVPIGLPTWTGQFGIAGRDSGGSSARRGRGGPSSASLISNLNPGAATSTQRNSPGPSAGRMPRGEEFIPLIKNFFRSRRGPVLSQVIIDHFNHYCPTEQRQQEFYGIMKKVAQLTRDSRDRGVWSLKPEHAARRRAT